MGQYFRAVCPDRKEFISLSGGMKVIERITDARAMTQLAMLLYDHDAPDDYYDYYGRWAGCDVKLVGDYAEGDLYSAPDPDVKVAPLSNPNLIREDTSTSTAPDPDAVTEDWVVDMPYARSPLLKGTWSSRGPGHFSVKQPSTDHPDNELTVGTYMRLKESDDDRLDEDTVGVVTDIQNEWVDVTDGVEREMQLLVDDGVIEQDDVNLLPKRILEA